MAEINKKDLDALNTIVDMTDIDSADDHEVEEYYAASDYLAQRLLLLAEIEETPFKAIEIKRAKYDHYRNRRM